MALQLVTELPFPDWAAIPDQSDASPSTPIDAAKAIPCGSIIATRTALRTTSKQRLKLRTTAFFFFVLDIRASSLRLPARPALFPTRRAPSGEEGREPPTARKA